MTRIWLYCLLFLPSAHAHLWDGGSGPGNGTDYVKVVFAQAYSDLMASAMIETEERLASRSFDPDILRWLFGGKPSRFRQMMELLPRVQLRFQREPCSDESGIPASVCYFWTSDREPYVVVSVTENKLTSVQLGGVMLLHELGHFVGEPDHLFLDRMGVQLHRALVANQVLIVNEEVRAVVAAPFVAAESCSRGESFQVDQLKAKMMASLIVQCRRLGRECSGSKPLFTFEGEANFLPGQGFDSSVTCKGKGVLDLATVSN